jgi:hypothetical protein
MLQMAERRRHWNRGSKADAGDAHLPPLPVRCIKVEQHVPGGLAEQIGAEQPVAETTFTMQLPREQG